MHLAGRNFRKFHEEVKHLTASFVYINKKGFYPTEMNIEIVNHLESNITIPAFPFAYYLPFLCAYHGNDIHGRFEALKHLECVVNDKLNGLDLKDSAINKY